MDNIIYLILRRMRQPLLTLIVAYSIATLGLVLIPGLDADGQPWRFSFFEAFYFVSFMATTIGFGEIPYTFSEGQRLWVTLTIYATVISWIYAIGTLIALIQDRTFQDALAENSFARHIRGFREPFYLVCGYGETGSALTKALTDRGQQVVVIDRDASRVNLIKLQNLRRYVPALRADARLPLHLTEAGLKNPHCAAVVALTNDNETNLKIAITSKLLHPDIKVICRADSHDYEKNLASFGTDHIIDPFDTFATHLVTAFQAPCLYLLQRWLTGREHSVLQEPVFPPTGGHWVICGYGRFGKAVAARLEQEAIKMTFIEAHPEQTGRPVEGLVIARGTEADSLEQAGISEAVGLVAGTDNDANNLSIVMTARELNPDLFVIVRQNQFDNRSIMKAVGAQMIMDPSKIIADKIRVLAATPMLYEFISLALHEEDEWACRLDSRISALVHTEVPVVREWEIDDTFGWAVWDAVRAGQRVTLEEILRDPWNRDRALPCMVLLLRRKNDRLLLPEGDAALKPGDRLLLCGHRSAFTRLGWTLAHRQTLAWVRSGGSVPQGWLWRKLRKWR